MSYNSRKTKKFVRAHVKQDTLLLEEELNQYDPYDWYDWDDDCPCCQPPNMDDIRWGFLLKLLGLAGVRSARTLEEDWHW